jgi:small subunit ribosomal protein S6
VERAVRKYELMTIFRPELAEADVRSEVAQIEKALVERGATIEKSDFWGKRRLAYEIKHLTEGYYAVVAFEGETSSVEDLDRALSLSDNVVRHKFIRPE